MLECGAPVNIMLPTRDISGTAFSQMVLQLPDNRGRPAYPHMPTRGTDAGGNEECLIRLPSKCCLKASWTRCT
ncbi:MAG: hypothetical protein ACLR0N_03365 [Bilophila wadsworthia]